MDLDPTPTRSHPVIAVNDAPAGPTTRSRRWRNGLHLHRRRLRLQRRDTPVNAFARCGSARCPGAALANNGTAAEVTVSDMIFAANISAGLLTFTPAANGKASAIPASPSRCTTPTADGADFQDTHAEHGSPSTSPRSTTRRPAATRRSLRWRTRPTRSPPPTSASATSTAGDTLSAVRIDSQTLPAAGDPRARWHERRWSTATSILVG